MRRRPPAPDLPRAPFAHVSAREVGRAPRVLTAVHRHCRLATDVDTAVRCDSMRPRDGPTPELVCSLAETKVLARRTGLYCAQIAKKRQKCPVRPQGA